MRRPDYIVLLIGLLLGAGLTIAAYAIGAEVGQARALRPDLVRWEGQICSPLPSELPNDR